MFFLKWAYTECMKCTYCGLLKEQCCDPRDLVNRSKDHCVVCEVSLFKREPSFYRRLEQMRLRGNYCRACDLEAEKISRPYGKYGSTEPRNDYPQVGARQV